MSLPAYDPRTLGARCDECPLREVRIGLPVPSELSPGAKVLIVAQEPGEEEVDAGRPLIGSSGRELQRALTSIGVARSDVALENVAHSRPPGNEMGKFLFTLGKTNAARRKNGELPLPTPQACCLAATSRVRLPDGTTRTIRELVSAKFSGDVLSVDAPTGCLVSRRVIGWHANPRAGRALYRVSTARTVGTARGAVGAVVTADHPVLTQRGWVPAAFVRDADSVATGDAQLVGTAWSVLVGTLLGDGAGDAKTNRGMLRFSHVVDNADYVYAKARALRAITCSIRKVPPKVHLDGAVTREALQWTSSTTRWTKAVVDQFYPRRGRKRVPRNIQLDPIAVAVWFMDDGYTCLRENRNARAEIATNAFRREDVQFLADQLCITFGIECHLRFAHGWRIDFGVKATRALSALIAPFVPPSMQYKLLPEHRGRFLESLYEPPPAVTYFDQARVRPLPRTHKAYRDQTVYCIDVEGTQSFATIGGVVHNCRPRFLSVLRRYHDVIPVGQVALCAIIGAPECDACGGAGVFGSDERKCRACNGSGEKRGASIMALRGGPIEGWLDAVGKFHYGNLYEPGAHPLRVLPTIHPAFVLRAQRWRKVFWSDLAKAFRWFNGTLGWKDPVMTFNPSVDQLRKFLAEHWARQRALAFDYETDGIEPLACRPRCLGIGTKDHGVAVGFLSIDGYTRFYAPSDEEQIGRELAQWLTARDWYKEAWNRIYDSQIAKRQLGVDARPVIDGLLLHKSVESELPHGLGFVGSIMTDAPSWKAANTALNARSDVDLWSYCLRDVAITDTVIEPLRKSVEMRGQTAVAVFDHKVAWCCEGLHETGLYVDQAKREAWDRNLREDAIEFRKWCRAAAEDETLNPGSYPKCRELLFGKWALPVVDTTDMGEASTGDAVLRKLFVQKKTPERARMFIDALRRFRRKIKYRGTYVRKMVGRDVEIARDDLSEDIDELEQLAGVSGEQREEKEYEELIDRARSVAARKAKSKAQKRCGVLLADGRVHGGYSPLPTSGRLSSSDPNCFDAATEILTPRGWVKFPELREADLVAQWDAGTISFVAPTARQVLPYSGEMVELRNQHIDLRVTADHRCLTRNRKTGALRVTPASAYPRDAQQIHAGTTRGGVGLAISDGILQLVCALQADGSYHVGGGLEFGFHRPRKIQRLESILRALGVPFTKSAPKKRTTAWKANAERTRFYVAPCRAVEVARTLLRDSKTFGPWLFDLTLQQLRVVVDEVFLWDGLSTRKTNYSSSVEANVDFLQAAMTLVGWRVKKRVYVARGGRPNYQLDVTRREWSMTANIARTATRVENEVVYCVSVPSTYVVVRRNGRVVVTGQCQNWPKKLRDMIIAEPGNVLVGCDADQIELRVAAALAGAAMYLDAFKTGKDPHTLAALLTADANGKKLYEDAVRRLGEKEAKEDKHWGRIRDFTKRAQYGTLYGCEVATLHETLTEAEDDDDNLIYANMELRETRRWREKWLEANPEFSRWWENEILLFRRLGYLADALIGRRRDFLDGEDRNEILNYRSQSTAAAVVHSAMLDLCVGSDAPLRFFRWGPGTGLVQQGHDALVFEVPEEKGKWAAGLVQEAMTRRVPGLDVLFTAKAKIGKIWSKV